MSTATFTDLLRKPKEVLASIDEEQVRITRRDGDDLVILRGGDLDALSHGIALSSQIFRAIGRNKGDAVAAVRDLYAWTAELSDSEVAAFAEEMERLVYAASELGSFDKLMRALTEWRETAAAYATGLADHNANDELDEAPFVRVPRP